MTIASSAVTYVVSTSITILDRLTWQDKIRVVSLQLPGKITIKNSGDGHVYLESYKIEAVEINHSSGSPLNERVEKGDFRTITVGGTFNGSIVAGVTNEDWNLLKTGNVAGYMPLFFEKDSTALAVFKRRFAGSLRIFPAKLEIIYHSLVSDVRLPFEIECEGVFVKLQEAQTTTEVFVPKKQ